MEKNITYCCLIVLIFFFSSCFVQKEKEKETDGISIFRMVDPEQVAISPTSSIVKLETTDSCLMGYIVQIEKDDSIIFILDSYKKIYAFDCNGNFLNTVGKQGESAESYLACQFFYLDKKKKVLSVVDYARSKVLHYTYRGGYLSLEEMQSPEDIRWCSKGMVGNDGNLMVYRSMNPFDNFQFALFDSGNNYSCLWKSYSYDPIRIKDHAVDFSNHPMEETKDGIHFILPLCDTIFQYNQGEVNPLYVIELPRPMLPKKLFTKELDTRNSYFSTTNELAGDKYFSGFTNIFETSTHMLLTYSDRLLGWYYLADKKEKKGFIRPFSMSSNLTDIPFLEVVSSTENEFIGMVSCEILLNKEEDVEDKSAIHPDLKKILAISQFDDNPCLVFYRF